MVEILIIIGLMSGISLGGYLFFKGGKNKPYSVQKREIKRVYSSLISDMKVDRGDNKIDSMNIENIGNSILIFEKRIITLQQTFIGDNIIIKDNGEEKWLTEFCIEFVSKLNIWLEFHSKELEKLSNTLDNHNDKTQNNTFKGNLEYHSALIDNQIQEIKKIKR